MDSLIAATLAGRLEEHQRALCAQVSARLLKVHPELASSLRLEEQYAPAERLSEVAVERLSELVRTVLLFEQPTLADGELAWAHGTLPQRGVTHQHQAAMVRWFFEELRALPLSVGEQQLSRELEHYFLTVVSRVYNVA
jgi:hypothetical protein